MGDDTMLYRMRMTCVTATILIACMCAWAQRDSASVDDGGAALSPDSTRGVGGDVAPEASVKPEENGGVQQDAGEQPFPGADEQGAEPYPQGNPFMAVADVGDEEAPADSPSTPVLFIDISRGVTLSDLFVEPDDLNVTVRPGFVWDLGARLPLRRWLCIGLGIRYFEAAFNIEDSYIGIDNEVSTKTQESMRFVSLPIEVTAILDLTRVLPYMSVTVEPALFASGFYFAKQRVSTTFPDRSTLVTERSYDSDISEDRERYQVFAGGGVGVEIPYGFASIYLQGSCLVSVRDIGNDNTRPMRTVSRLLYIPISLGLRFTL